EVEAEVADDLVLAEDVVVEVGVVDGKIVEAEEAAVVDQGALVRRDVRERTGVGLALDLLELAVEALERGVGEERRREEEDERRGREQLALREHGGLDRRVGSAAA